MTSRGSILIERLPDGTYRASAPQWPDCTATAATEEEARRAVEQAIEHLQRRLAKRDSAG